MLTQKPKDRNPQACAAKKTSIGGQALIEGIMMRGPAVTAMAVRNPDGKIILEKEQTGGKKPPKLLRLPLIRGIYGMINSFTVGYKYLMRSAEIAGLDDTDDGAKNGEKKSLVIPQNNADSTDAATSADAPTAEEAVTEAAAESAPVASTDTPNKDGIPETAEAAAKDAGCDMDRSDASEAVSETGVDAAENGEKVNKEGGDASGGIPKALLNGVMIVGSVLGVLLAVVLFIYLPKLLFNLVVVKLFGVVKPEATAPYGERYLYQMLVSAFTGILKIAIFVCYMALVSLMKDIKRTFMYHGAEHKTIFCYEQGLPLTVENIRRQRRFHPRCGTSFMIVMLLISIIIGFFVPICADWLYVLIKLLLVPFAVGIGYEFIKFAGRHDGVIVRILSAPGLWMQRISTKEPTDDMIECAIAAMNEVIPGDGSDNL